MSRYRTEAICAYIGVYGFGRGSDQSELKGDIGSRST